MSGKKSTRALSLKINDNLKLFGQRTAEQRDDIQEVTLINAITATSEYNSTIIEEFSALSLYSLEHPAVTITASTRGLQSNNSDSFTTENIQACTHNNASIAISLFYISDVPLCASGLDSDLSM